jgi:hypothetical protein
MGVTGSAGVLASVQLRGEREAAAMHMVGSTTWLCLSEVGLNWDIVKVWVAGVEREREIDDAEDVSLLCVVVQTRGFRSGRKP